MLNTNEVSWKKKPWITLFHFKSARRNHFYRPNSFFSLFLSLSLKTTPLSKPEKLRTETRLWRWGKSIDSSLPRFQRLITIPRCQRRAKQRAGIAGMSLNRDGRNDRSKTSKGWRRVVIRFANCSFDDEVPSATVDASTSCIHVIWPRSWGLSEV